MAESITSKIAENIYSFPIPLPDNPLRWLNCYVVKGREGERSLLIDTGFNRSECFEALMQGMEELGLKPEDTDIFLTHLHSDHTGNAPKLHEMGSRIIISTIDKARLHKARWSGRMQLFQREGMPATLVDEVHRSNPGMLYAPDLFDAIEVSNGDMLSYGGYDFRCLHTPGHTPGHMCLFDKKARLLFSGDHVLFDISPNICVWEGFTDAVGTYMESLKMVMELDVDICLPAHRNRGEVTMAERAQKLIEHHIRRLNETERLIGENPGINAYDLAGLMSWRIRARSWDEFPPAQKNFALLETLAHIDYLLIRGKFQRKMLENSVNGYWPVQE